MRDVIWTIIAIWVIYKLVDIFRGSGSKKDSAYQAKESKVRTYPNSVRADVRDAKRKSADNEGEYVDFEEVN